MVIKSLSSAPAAAKEEQTFFIQMTAELLGHDRSKAVNSKSEICIAAGHIEISDFAQIDHSD